MMDNATQLLIQNVYRATSYRMIIEEAKDALKAGLIHSAIESLLQAEKVDGIAAKYAEIQAAKESAEDAARIEVGKSVEDSDKG